MTAEKIKVEGAVQPVQPTETPIEVGKLFNPTSEDFTFTYNNAPYTVKAGQVNDKLLSHIADHGAKKLADTMIVTTNPEEHRVFKQAIIENVEPSIIAKNLGIDLVKIRKQASVKNKEGVKVANLESQIKTQNDQISEMKKTLDGLASQIKPIEKSKKEYPCEVEGCDEVFGHHKTRDKHVREVHPEPVAEQPEPPVVPVVPVVETPVVETPVVPEIPVAEPTAPVPEE